MLTYQAGRYFATGEAPPSSGNQHPTIVPYGVYRASDAYFNLAVGTEDLWRRFCAALELEPLRADPRFATNRDRLAHRDQLNALLEPLFAGHTINQIQELMDQASVPCGAVRDLHGVFTDPQVAALGLIESLDHPTAGAIKLVGPPYRLSETPPSVRLPPPLLGQHTDEVLRELAYDDATIGALREAHVVA
jgi:crotonobetainyl-CoA:carnitine CoA-transferase CaiB-like acyl-CoA transferase